MAGTPTNFDITRIHQGPGNLWVIGGGVADSAAPQLTIFADGTPDATAHPSSIHLGATDSAITSVYAPKVEAIHIDQANGPVAHVTVEEAGGIEAELKQLDFNIIQQCVAMGVYATAGGYKQITFGGLQGALTPLCIALIAQKRGAAGKYIVSILFKAIGTMGLNTAVGKAKASMYKAKFEGEEDMTRTAGRRMGIVYETI